jgi:hypothetical protein
MKTFKQHISELRKSTLQSYIQKSDAQAKELDATAKQQKNPVDRIGTIQKASKRGLGAFKAHLKVGLAKEDMVAGAVSSGPTNVVSTGEIKGTGGLGGEPGVGKRKKPILGYFKRKNI